MPIDLAFVPPLTSREVTELVNNLISHNLCPRSAAVVRNDAPKLLLCPEPILNKIMDLFVWRGEPGAAQFGESLRDLLNTMLRPTVFMLAARARARKQVFAGGRNFPLGMDL